MKLLSGTQLAEEIIERLKEDVALLSAPPGMAAILVGNNEASKMYVGLKEKTATEIGIRFLDYALPTGAAQADVLALIDTLNKDESIHGILVQLPLPRNFEKEAIISAIDPKKDIDGLTPENQQLFLNGKPRFWCPFPRAIMTLLESTGENLKGKRAALLVNSQGLGETLSRALEEFGVKSTIVLPRELGAQKETIVSCDIVISALGDPERITAEFIKHGAIVIDGGIERVGEKVKGDMHPSVREKAAFLTPVPGGVGPLTIAHLMENILFSSEGKSKVK